LASSVAVDRPHGGFDPGFELELLQDVLDVDLDRADRPP
jgi:hypothetical protein